MALTLALSSLPIACSNAGSSGTDDSSTLSDTGDLVENDDLVFLAHGVAHHFAVARGDFEQNEKKAAADEIRAGEEILKAEVLDTSGKEEKTLLANIGELTDLADDVASGNIKSVQELDEAFARAHVGMAKYHQHKAAEATKRHDERDSERHSKAAAAHMEYAGSTITD